MHQSNARSLYTTLGIIVTVVVITVMSLFLSYNYYDTKNKLIAELDKKSQITLNRLKNSVIPFIESYSVNEYEKLISNEMADSSILGIVVEDYQTGNILGQKVFYNGKIRNNEWKVIPFNNNEVQNRNLKNSYLSLECDISSNNLKLAKLRLYFTDRFMNQDLDTLIEKSFFITITVSLVLILFLFISINRYILRPIENIVRSITAPGKDGLPSAHLFSKGSKEIMELTTSMNEMIDAVRDFRDKSEKLQIDLEEERNKYKNMMENSSDAILIVNMKGFIVEYSKEAQTLLGYNENEMLTLHISDFEALHSKEKIAENINKVQYAPLNFNTKYKNKKGLVFDVSVNLIKIKLGIEEYLYASVRDISQQIKLQKEIFEQKEEFETIFNYSHDGIAIIDLDTRFLNCNKAFLEISGYTKEELLKKTCDELTAPEDREKNKEAIEYAIINGNYENIEKDCIVNNDKRISVSMGISLLPDKKRLLLTLKDTTTAKLLESQSKLAAMGEMIGNIAHQWRQPLSVITTSASGLEMKSEFEQELSKEDIKDFAEIIVKQADYLSKTIDDFRSFIKGDSKYLQISIKEALRETLSLVDAALINNHINLIENIEDDLFIYGNKNELSQALINIINNAKDAMKEKVEKDEDRFLFISTKLMDENSLELKILDSGEGIPENIMGHIFEPYFTTKQESAGTGIGLSMADRIIRQRHKASITVHNQEFEQNGKNYKGACFIITFRAGMQS